MMSYESPYQALKESGIRNLVNEFYNFIKLNSLFTLIFNLQLLLMSLYFKGL